MSARPPSHPESTEQETAAPAARRSRLATALEALALLPAIAMIVEVTRSPRLQMLDYWDVLLRIMNPDGSFHPSGLLFLQNEHPLAVPSFLYWLDARVFAGDNRVLGYVVVLIAALTVLVLRAALPRTIAPIGRAALVVAVSALIFSPHGLHNFAIAMSGTAWLLANLFAVTALLLAVRGRWWPAWLAGLLACLSYGTGFPVWIALAVIAAVRKEPLWRRVLPLGVLAAVIVSWMSLRPDVNPGGAPANDIGTLMFRFFTVVGHLWTEKDAGVAAIAGVAIVAAYAVLLTVRTARTPELAFWWALAAHGVLCSGMIALARMDFGADQGLSGRYTSLSTLASVPLLVIVASVVRDLAPRHATRLSVVAVGVGVLGFTLGSPVAQSVRSALRETPVQAVAMRSGVADSLGYRMPPSEKLTPTLSRIGHYPYSADFTLGCGGPELGSKIDLDTASALPPTPGADSNVPQRAGWIDSAEKRRDAVMVRGWATGGEAAVRCVVVTDSTGTVTGGGMANLQRPDVRASLRWAGLDTGFVVAAPDRAGSWIVVVLDDGTVLKAPVKVTPAGGKK